MNHPETILRTLDGFLTRPTLLIIYGRAALALGYPQPNQTTSPEEFAATLDVDAILPLSELDAIEADEQFWNALEMTNQTLVSQNLYITHLFQEDQLILSPDWLDHLVPVPLVPPFIHLQLFRPSTIDLALTKMMRIDPQDREDLLFLTSQLSHEKRDQLTTSFSSATCPDIPEIQEAFVANQKWLGDSMA